MDIIIAACGLDCAACPAYVATAANDLKALEKLAEDWGKQFGFSAPPEALRCHGCHATDGVQIGHCAECGVRACAVAKGHGNCGECPEYGCQKMKAFTDQVPEAAARLAGVHSRILEAKRT